MSLSLTHVIFEMDCKHVVDRIHITRADNSELGALILECQHLLSLNPFYRLYFVRRNLNKAAHNLAKFSLSLCQDCINNYAPACISAVSSMKFSNFSSVKGKKISVSFQVCLNMFLCLIF